MQIQRTFTDKDKANLKPYKDAAERIFRATGIQDCDILVDAFSNLEPRRYFCCYKYTTDASNTYTYNYLFYLRPLMPLILTSTTINIVTRLAMEKNLEDAKVEKVEVMKEQALLEMKLRNIKLNGVDRFDASTLRLRAIEDELDFARKRIAESRARTHRIENLLMRVREGVKKLARATGVDMSIDGAGGGSDLVRHFTTVVNSKPYTNPHLNSTVNHCV